VHIRVEEENQHKLLERVPSDEGQKVESMLLEGRYFRLLYPEIVLIHDQVFEYYRLDRSVRIIVPFG
jgi:hypothetical protein